MARLAGCELTVYIHGETGAGKEIVARALHRRSRRGRGPFVAVNLAAFSDELFDAELFGHTRGAFTGAIAAREGYVQKAHGGTLLIDEVGELSSPAQVKLLRFLEVREYHRLGESTPRKADVRVLSATNVDLQRRVAEGRFREDLLYRLTRSRLHVPPLRDRGGDVVLLARQLLRRAADRNGLPVPALTDPVLEVVRTFPWPGNVRQLENEMELQVVYAHGGPTQVEYFSSDVTDAHAPGPSSLRKARSAFESEWLRRAMARHDTLGGVAAELGISRQALHKMRRRYGL
jgi:DNA-binding NtrC family response regulator